jgi:hypothetical protein
MTTHAFDDGSEIVAMFAEHIISANALVEGRISPEMSAFGNLCAQTALLDDY